ncbi:cupin domain-containing protein [Rubrimonas cliftonensis]|uniref:Cupin domain-containing protein n=1 Tax=Rubrimonas cliftonensis TaxID=89524 RepID=A0A1H4D4E0_9RHOB|nr:cupin domain-containing protein [Rubrimonas cliftonensis]SEA67615.1 Cupin domain-containing protein [Rubrimonas cliftonensis]
MKISRDDLSPARPQLAGLLHGADMGEMQGAYLTIPAGTDFCPLLAGLPNDHCQRPHWGYLIEGRIVVTYEDGREEVVEAGDFYYWPPGHVVRMEEATKQVEFSPREEMHAVLDHVVSRMG